MKSTDFLKGHYQKTIADWQSSELDENESTYDWSSLVGALCFSGNELEAKKVFKDQFTKLSSENKAACRFFLGLLYTRKSKYKKAQKKFKRNLSMLTNESSFLQKFYVYQGIAFYLFFLGKFSASQKWALKSFEAASDSKDIYARSLATDLLGHIKMRLGEISVGLDFLKSAEKLSVRLGNIGLSEAIAGARLQYLAYYGHHKETIVEELLSVFNSLKSEDNYTRAAIGLELARQYSLRGLFQDCESVLEMIAPDIFKTENRRQEIQLNLRFAELSFLIGRDVLSLNYLRAARRCLNFEADRNFEIQILGLELKLQDIKSHTTTDLNPLLLSKNYNSIVNKNIISRLNKENGFPNDSLSEFTFNSEDFIHNFQMSLETSHDVIDLIVQSNYLSFLIKYLNIPRGKGFLYLDHGKNLLITYSGSKIQVIKNQLTPTDLKVLVCLLNGFTSKEEICHKVWGYAFDQIRHESMIYSAIRSLRKNLKESSHWIETRDEGYIFSEVRSYKIINSFKKMPPVYIETNEEKQDLTYLSHLNLRQIKAIEYLSRKESLDVKS
jgi:DNA-binding winged helix-turn-helix (wHTH) protein